MHTTNIYALGFVKETTFKGRSAKGVLRLADVDSTDRLTEFKKRGEGLFEDRDFFFLNDEHRHRDDFPGRWAFWRMEVVPHDSFPSKDHVRKVDRDIDKKPIAVCSSSCRSLEELIHYLHSPAFAKLIQEVVKKIDCSILLTFYEEQKNRGILIKTDDIDDDQLSPLIMTLPIYSVNKLPLRFPNLMPNKVCGFWPSTTLGSPEDYLPLVPLKVALLQSIKDRTASWSAFQLSCPQATHSDNNVYRTFIDALKSQATADAVISQFQPTQEQYDEAIENLITEGELFFENNDEISQIASQILSRDQSLIQSVKDEMTTRWEIDHKELIEKAQADKEDLEKTLVSLNADLEKTQNSLSTEKKKLQDLRRDKESLMRECSLQLERIKSDTAQTLSQYSLWHLLTNGSTIGSLRTTGELRSQSVGFDEVRKSKHLTEATNIEEVIVTLEENLTDVGVNDEEAEGLAAVLLAAYAKGLPLILAGPAVQNLADALSLSIFGCTARHIDGSVLSIGDAPQDTVNLITDVVRDNRIEHLLIDAVRHQRFVIFDLPFAEELALMSPGILHYAQVICTELFVTNEPSDCMLALQLAETVHNELRSIKPVRRKLVFAKYMTVTPLIKNKTASWLELANALSSEAVSDDIEARLLLLPQALLTGHFSALSELLADEDSKVPSSTRSLLSGSLALYGRDVL